jgi:cell division protein FtsB
MNNDSAWLQTASLLQVLISRSHTSAYVTNKLITVITQKDAKIAALQEENFQLKKQLEEQKELLQSQYVREIWLEGLTHKELTQMSRFNCHCFHDWISTSKSKRSSG